MPVADEIKLNLLYSLAEVHRQRECRHVGVYALEAPARDTTVRASPFSVQKALCARALFAF